MRKFIALIFILLVSGNSHANSHVNRNWTGEIGMITVFEDGSSSIIISNPRNGPASSMSCIQNVVYLGVKNSPANKALLSQAMVVFVTGKTIRFGVRGSGDSCEGFYITAE